MSTPVCRRLLALALLVPALLAAGEGLHHHETLAALLSPAGAGDTRVVSSHNPLSRACHWHASVLVHEDPCVACSVHRAGGLPAEVGFEPALTASFRARAFTASIRPSFSLLALGSRAPPALL